MTIRIPTATLAALALGATLALSPSAGADKLTDLVKSKLKGEGSLEKDAKAKAEGKSSVEEMMKAKLGGAKADDKAKPATGQSMEEMMRAKLQEKKDQEKKPESFLEKMIDKVQKKGVRGTAMELGEQLKDSVLNRFKKEEAPRRDLLKEYQEQKKGQTIEEMIRAKMGGGKPEPKPEAAPKPQPQGKTLMDLIKEKLQKK
jgi:hypothetical protein